MALKDNGVAFQNMVLCCCSWLLAAPPDAAMAADRQCIIASSTTKLSSAVMCIRSSMRASKSTANFASTAVCRMGPTARPTRQPHAVCIVSGSRHPPAVCGWLMYGLRSQVAVCFAALSLSSSLLITGMQPGHQHVQKQGAACLKTQQLHACRMLWVGACVPLWHAELVRLHAVLKPLVSWRNCGVHA